MENKPKHTPDCCNRNGGEGANWTKDLRQNIITVKAAISKAEGKS